MADIPNVSENYIPTKADLEHCPLCLKKWAIYEEPTKLGKAYFFCVEDMISIWVRDPLLGRWHYTEKETCHVCGEPNMRLFFRSDLYIKMYCPKCKAFVESVDDEKHAAMMRKEIAEGSRTMLKGLDQTDTKEEI